MFETEKDNRIHIELAGIVEMKQQDVCLSKQILKRGEIIIPARETHSRELREISSKRCLVGTLQGSQVNSTYNLSYLSFVLYFAKP